MSSGIRHDRMRRRLLLLALAGAAVLLAGLCGGLVRAMAGEAASPSPATPVTLRVGWVNEPDNLNPFIGYSTSSYLVYHLNYDQLTGYTAADVTPAPDLAESWTTSADGLEWTFKLRQGVKWQDGEPFTSADVVFTYDYIIKNQLAAFTSYTDRHHQGGGRRRPHGASSRRPSPRRTCSGWSCPSCPSTSGARSARRRRGPPSRTSRRSSARGPFQVVDFKKGDFVRMAANRAVLARRAQDRRGDLPVLHQRRQPWCRTSRAAPSTPAGASPKHSSSP